MRKNIFLAIAFSLVSATLAGGQESEPQVVWPQAPETARIEYTAALRSERDLGRRPGFFTRVFNSIVGGGEDYFRVSRPNDVYSFDGRRVFISDGSIGKLVLFDREERTTTVVGESGPGELSRPVGIGGDAAGNIYVTDQSRRRVVVFDSDGVYLRDFGSPDLLLNPVDVAVDDEAGLYYVVDSYLHQVVVFDVAGNVIGRRGRDVADRTDLANAQMRLSHNSSSDSLSHGLGPRDLVDNRGSEVGEFKYPLAIAVSADGTLYVSDALNFRVQALDRDGNVLRQIGRLGDNPGSFARPKGVAVDSDGNVYVADASFNNVQVFNPNGELLIAFARGGQRAGELLLPLGMHIDVNDQIYIADRYNNRAQLFRLLAVEGDGDQDVSSGG